MRLCNRQLKDARSGNIHMIHEIPSLGKHIDIELNDLINRQKFVSVYDHIRNFSH